MELRSKRYPQKTIVYLADYVNPGMIYWYYKYDGKETRLAKKIEAANEKGQEEECEVGQIGEKAVDIAAIALAGYTLSEIIAILAEYWGMEYTVVEEAISGWFPIILPTPMLDHEMDRMDQWLNPGGEIVA